MKEKFTLYNKEGKVDDPEIAQSMANKENPSHKKFLGVFPASKRNIAEGEKRGALEGEEIIERKNYRAMIQEIKGRIKDFKVSSEYTEEGRGIPTGGEPSPLKYINVSFEIDGHKMKIKMRHLGTVYRISNGSIDGRNLNNEKIRELKTEGVENAIYHLICGEIGYSAGVK